MSDSQGLVDADSHVLEPPDVWEQWLPQKHQEKAPKLVKDSEGGDAWLFAGAAEPDPIGLVATPGRALEDFRWKGVTYEEARTACYDGQARLGDMDIDGVDAELIFGPQRTIAHFLADEDDDFVRAGIDAYNNFLIDGFCSANPERLWAVGQIPSTGIDDAVDYLRKLSGRGVRAVTIAGWPAGGDSIQPEDDRFWAAAVDEGLPVCIHIQVISRRARQAARAAEVQKGRSDLYGSKGAGAERARAVGGLGSVFTVVARTVAELIFSGVFERFPSLHVSLIETGVGWMPHFLEQMDDRYWRNRAWAKLDLAEVPSTYFRRNMSAAFMRDYSGVALRHAVGVENMLWSSDYPHHGNDWPYSRRLVADMLYGVPTEERRLMVGGNARRIFGAER